jgi:putative lipoic acid-binding regulatory protein
MMPSVDAAERERLRAVLEATHVFPGPFYLSVITLNREATGLALGRAIESVCDLTIPDEAWERRSSSGGKYMSHRVTVQCRSADEVLALYAVVRTVDGVVTVL